MTEALHIVMLVCWIIVVCDSLVRWRKYHRVEQEVQQIRDSLWGITLDLYRLRAFSHCESTVEDITTELIEKLEGTL